MAKQTGSLDLRAAKKAHDEAEKVATNYVTDITNGIFVSPEGEGPSDTQTPTGWKISSALELIKSGVTYLKAWLAGTNSDTPTVQVGPDSAGHTVIDNNGMRVYGSSGGLQLANIGYGAGADGQGGTSNAPYYTLGVRDGSIGNYSTAEGYETEASEFASHAEGEGTTASGGMSHAEGYNTTASGAESHAEGYDTTASGNWSHAEGQLAVASDEGAHAEGLHTTASGVNAHAEGSVTTASGFDAHAQNGGTVASGDYSHAGGDSTIAGYDSQTTIGRYNDNQSATAFEIGNGTADNARSNALTVDWSGNVEASGSITAGGHTQEIGFFGRSNGSYSCPANTSYHDTGYHTPATSDADCLSAGTWLLVAHVTFPSNNTGRRTIRLFNTTTSAEIGRSVVTRTATQGATTQMITTCVIQITAKNQYRVDIMQNSGSPASCDIDFTWTRIA